MDGLLAALWVERGNSALVCGVQHNQVALDKVQSPVQVGIDGS